MAKPLSQQSPWVYFCSHRCCYTGYRRLQAQVSIQLVNLDRILDLLLLESCPIRRHEIRSVPTKYAPTALFVDVHRIDGLHLLHRRTRFLEEWRCWFDVGSTDLRRIDRKLVFTRS